MLVERAQLHYEQFDGAGATADDAADGARRHAPLIEQYTRAIIWH